MALDPTPGTSNKRRIVEPVREKFVGDTSTVTHKQPRRDPAVIERQRLLRARGYSITIDGIWGPASQSAWRSYQASQTRTTPSPTSSGLAAAGRREQFQIQRRHQQLARQAAARARALAKQSAMRQDQLKQQLDDRAEREVHLQAIRRDLAAIHQVRASAPAVASRVERVRAQFHQEQAGARQVIAETRKQVAFARRARAKAPEDWTLRELLAVTTDSITGTLDPRKPAEVTKVQRWLKANGHPEVKVDGTWGAKTHDALFAIFRKKQEEEQAARRKTLVKRFYAPGIIKAGDPFGPLSSAPDADGLEALLKQGGFTASLVWEELTKKAFTPDAEWVRFQEEQVLALEKELRPSIAGLRPFEPAKFLKPTLESRFLGLQFSALQNRGSGVFTDSEASLVIQQLGALQQSRSPEELQMRLTDIGRNIEAHERAKQMQDASRRPSWWERDWDYVKTGLYLMGKPAETVTDEFLQSVFRLKTFADTGEVQASGAEREEIKARVDEWQKEHPWINLGLEVAMDPLWLVAPLKWTAAAGRLTMTGALHLERFGLGLNEAGKVAKLSSPLLSAPAHTLRGVSLLGQGIRHPIKTELGQIGRTLQADHIQTVARKLSASKREMAATVKHRVRVMRRSRFTNLDTALWGSHTPGLGRIKYDIDAKAPHFRAALTSLARTVVPTLQKNRASIFAHIGRDTDDTIIGGQVRARLTRATEQYALQNLALDEGHIAFVVKKYGDEKLGELLRKHKLSGSVFEALRTNRISSPSESLIRKYQAVLDEYGGEIVPLFPDDEAVLAGRGAFGDVMRRGGYSSIAVGDLQIEKRLAEQMDKLQDDIGDVLNSIQDELEERLELEANALREAAKQSGEEGVEIPALFDENGRWVDAGGELSDLARQVGRDAYDATKPIPNPNHGIEHTYDEMMQLRSIEEARAIRHITGLQSRRAVEGVAMKSEVAEGLIQKRLDEIDAGWTQEGSRFIDTRTHLEVPTIYLRNLRAAYRGPLENGLVSLEDLPKELRELLAVAEPPASTVESPFDDELETLAYFISRTRSLSESDLAISGGAPDFLIRSLPYNSETVAIGAKFTSTLKEYSELLDLAEGYVTSKEMLREWAVWAALSKAQSAPLRAAYTGLSASLDVWLTMTLPLRPGFLIRNVVDNTAKMLVAGARDPRFYFLGAEKPGNAIRSIFELNINAIRKTLILAGAHQDSKAIYYFDRLMESFWAHSADVVKKVFSAHQIDVPESWIRDYQSYAADTAPTWIRDQRDKVWELVAGRPENYARRALFRSEMAKLKRAGVGEREAFDQALAKIDFTLFDYSKQTVLEDNLRFLTPFLFFWRKTAVFWGTTAINHPALPYAFGRFEETFQEEHEELPSWMRRYANLEPVTNVIAKVPGLEWLLPGIQDGLQTDPANFLSFNVLYRSFKSENPDLPPDKEGMRFIGPFVDALNQWGVSMNPLVRKPMEVAGVFNYRAWQTIFPQTNLIDAMSRRFFADRFGAAGLNLEAWAQDKVLAAIGYDFRSTERIVQGFDQWVQLEMAAQAQRGETVSRDAAEKKIQDYYAVQTVLGFFAGVYARRRNEADIYLYNLAEQMHTDFTAYESLSAKDQRAYQIFKRRKMDPLAFDRYLETLPAVESYYALGGDWDKMQQFKLKHPEVIPYVSPLWTKGRAFSDSFIKNAPLIADTGTAMQLFKLTETLELDFQTKKLAEAAFVTPELRAFWDRDQTPAKAQTQMLQGEYHRHLRKLNDGYFSIPEGDFEAREGYLKENPILAHWWDQNNSDSDDFKTILNSTNADLRDAYFEMVEDGDWDGARGFLKRFPFIFEFTKAAGKVRNGEFVGGGTSQKAKDYLAAKAHLDYYFSLGKSARQAWLSGGSAGALMVKAYFDKYAHGTGRTQSQHAKDYLAARAHLSIFFKLLRADKKSAYAWLNGDSEAAKIVREYFRKYAKRGGGGTSQHAVDYVAAKDELNHYFALLKKDKTAARAWLNGNSKEALVVKAYFKKYGKMAKVARNWTKVFGSKNPELNARLQFWQRYWKLEPDQRPDFVSDHAEEAGIFVYGTIGEQQRHEELQRYYRKALAHGFSKKTALYLRNKPLMDLYFTLKDPTEKGLFLRANPEIQLYLDTFSNATTGNKKLDGLLERYFSFPRRSDERSSFLQSNPKLQDYFDRNSKPADRAMHNLLEVYFAKEGAERKTFSQEHPEIQAYFDTRREERDRELLQAQAFDIADPRLDALRELAERTITKPGELMAESLRRARAVDAGEISSRRDRRQIPPD